MQKVSVREPGVVLVDRSQVSVLEQLRAAIPSLSPRTQQAARFVLAHPDRVVLMSAARLAGETGTSVGTVVRLCHTLGFSGVQALKLRLIAQLGRGPSAGVSPSDVSGAATFARIIDDLCHSALALDHAVVEQVVAILQSADRVLIVSSGTSQPLAIEFGNWLSSQGRAVAYPTDGGTQEAVAGQLGPADACFAISHSGTTTATLDPLCAAAARRTPTVALTSYSGSALAQLADHTIIAGASANGGRGDDMASRMVHHAVLQVISAALTASSVLPPSPAPLFSSRSI